MDSGALTGTLAFYLLASVALGAALLLRHGWLRSAGWCLAGAGAGLHMAAIGLRCAALHRAPFVTPAESLSLLAWLLVLLYLGAQALWRLTAAGAFALGLAFLLVFLAGRLGDATPEGVSAPLLAEQAVSLHVVATLAAFGAFALASCCGALFLLERYLLKTKRALGWLSHLPPLMTADRASLTLVAVGFPLLTLGTLSGLLRAAGGGLPQGWLLDPKSLVAYGVWAVHGVYLLARFRGNLAPARAAGLLLLGLSLCLLAFFVPTAAHRFDGKIVFLR